LFNTLRFKEYYCIELPIFASLIKFKQTMSFERFAKWTLLSIFLIIVAGGIVRMTGSGMGCPDWPKCFGLVIPPVHVDQVLWSAEKPFSEGQMIIHQDQLWFAHTPFVSGQVYDATNWSLYTKHDYVNFNPLHTWVEYVNRLIGVLAGFLTLGLFFKSFAFWKIKRKIVFLSAFIVFLMGFQGWLGAVVVYSVLQPIQITIHMLMALFIVALMVYLISEAPNKKVVSLLTHDKKLYVFIKIALLLSVLQIILGTQVRQLIDEIAKSFDYAQRELWIESAGNVFKIHRSFAISLVLVNGFLFVRNYVFNLGFSYPKYIAVVILVEVLSGIVLTYFDMMSLMQPIHLIVASLLFILQIAFYFELKKLKTK
jgi:cytochrome c oxidase assembly protein subunit 15